MILKIIEIKLEPRNFKWYCYKPHRKANCLWQKINKNADTLCLLMNFLTLFVIISSYLIIRERSQNSGNPKIFLKKFPLFTNAYVKKFATLEWIFKDQKQKANTKLQGKLNFTYLRKLQKTLCLYLFHKEGKWKDRFTENTKVMQKKNPKNQTNPNRLATQRGNEKDVSSINWISIAFHMPIRLF